MPEDVNSIQVALMQVMRLLLAQQIDQKTARLLLNALQTASTNLQLTRFDRFRHDVVLDPRDAPNTPLDSHHIWEDDDFEEEEDEIEIETDRAIAALETVGKKREDGVKWVRWAEKQYPGCSQRKITNPIYSSGEAVVTAPASAPAAAKPLPPNLKKPLSASTPEQIRAEIPDMARKQLLPDLNKKLGPGRQRDQEKKQEKEAT